MKLTTYMYGYLNVRKSNVDMKTQPSIAEKCRSCHNVCCYAHNKQYPSNSA